MKWFLADYDVCMLQSVSLLTPNNTGQLHVAAINSNNRPGVVFSLLEHCSYSLTIHLICILFLIIFYLYIV